MSERGNLVDPMRFDVAGQCHIEVWQVLGGMAPAKRGNPRRFHVVVEATDEESAVRNAMDRFASTKPGRIGEIEDVHRCHRVEQELARWTKAIFERARGK